MSKYTSGHWSVDGFNLTGVIALTPPRDKVDYICECKTDSNTIELEEAKANARLISAAPELLEACKEAYSIWKNEFKDLPFTIGGMAIKRLKQAISKAEGR